MRRRGGIGPLDPIYKVKTVYGSVDVGNTPGVIPTPPAKNLIILSSVTDASLNGAFDVNYDSVRDLCFVASNVFDGISCVDVSDPSAPVVVGSVSNSSTMNALRGIDRSGDFVGVVGSSGGNGLLAIIDVSDPTTPVVTGTLADPVMNGAYSIVIDGGLAYVGSTTADSLTVIDFFYPAPAVLGSITHSDLNGAQGVALVDSTHVAVACINSPRKLVIVDVSTPSSPTIAGGVTGTGMFPNDVAIEGNYAYVTNFTDTVKVIDVSTPSAPTIVGSFTEVTLDPNWVCQPSGTGWAAVTAYDSLVLGVIDITTPTAPVLLDTVTDALLNQALGCAVNDPYIYIACQVPDRLVIARWA